MSLQVHNKLCSPITFSKLGVSWEWKWSMEEKLVTVNSVTLSLSLSLLLDHARKLMVCHKSALTLSVMTSFIRWTGKKRKVDEMLSMLFHSNTVMMNFNGCVMRGAAASAWLLYILLHPPNSLISPFPSFILFPSLSTFFYPSNFFFNFSSFRSLIS